MTAATKSAPKAVKAAAKRPARPHPKPSVKAAQARKGKGTISTPGERAEDLYDSVKDVPSVPTTEVAHPNRVERVKLAKAEFAALKAWKIAGAKAPRPATPNLDAINRGESGSTAKAPKAVEGGTIAGFALVDRGLQTITCCTCKADKPGKVFPTRGKTHRTNECRECGVARRSS